MNENEIPIGEIEEQESYGGKPPEPVYSRLGGYVPEAHEIEPELDDLKEFNGLKTRLEVFTSSKGVKSYKVEVEEGTPEEVVRCGQRMSEHMDVFCQGFNESTEDF